MRRSCAGERQDALRECHPHVVGGAAVGQREQHHVTRLAFHERGDRGQPCLADDEVAFPVARHRSVLNLGGTLAEQHHAHQLAAARGPVVRTPLGTSGAQKASQLLAQRAPRLHEQRLVDRLVGHPQLRIVRMVCDESVRDLLG